RRRSAAPRWGISRRTPRRFGPIPGRNRGPVGRRPAAVALREGRRKTNFEVLARAPVSLGPDRHAGRMPHPTETAILDLLTSAPHADERLSIAGIAVFTGLSAAEVAPAVRRLNRLGALDCSVSLTGSGEMLTYYGARRC